MLEKSFVKPDHDETVFNVAMENYFFQKNINNLENLDDNQLKTLVKVIAQLGDEELLTHTMTLIEDKVHEGIIYKELKKETFLQSNSDFDYKLLEALGLDVGDSPSGESPVRQVIKEVRDLKMENRGVYITSQGNYDVEANTFARYLATKRLLIIREDQELYAYTDGFYKPLEDVVLRGVCREILNEVDSTIWKRRFQSEYIEALLMDIPTAADLIETSNKIAFTNGFLDLATEEFSEFSPQYFFSNKLDYKYDPEAKAPRFTQFLAEIFENDLERVSLMQELMGYLLVPDRRIHKMYIFKGSGANGKSVLLNVIEYLLGQKQVSNTPLNKLEGRFGLQNLKDKLVNISSENELGNSNIDTENIKAITGGDRVEVERKNQDSFSADLYTRLVVSVNNDFSFKDSSHGILRRLMFIPFNVRFYERPLNNKLVEGRFYQDPGLEYELLAELSGIFNLAYQGLIRLRNNNYVYSYSAICVTELERYIKYSDPIAGFIDDKLELGSDFEISKPDLNRLFDGWQKSHGSEYRVITASKAARLVEQRLDELGMYVLEKKTSGEYFLEGVGVKKQRITNKRRTLNGTTLGQKVSAIR